MNHRLWVIASLAVLTPAVPTPAQTTTAKQATARVVGGLTDIVAVAGGQHHFLALTATGTVLGWGYNGQGQLGNDTTTHSAVPVVASGLSNVTMMSAGTTHSLAVRADGTVWAWSGNENGQLGIVGGAQHVPAQVPGLSNPIAITAGWGVSYAVKPDGTLWVWGQVNGLVPGVTATTTPVQVPDLTGITAVTTGLAASFALGTDGRVWAWGSNLFGLLGDGTEQSRATPGLVPDLPAIRQIATAAHHVVAIADDGSVWAWGRNEFGQIGDLLAGTDRVRPMLVLQAGAVAPGGVATPAGTLDPTLDRVLFYHTDAIGSVRVVTDAGGAVVQRYDFTPFGFEWNAGADRETRRFTGQERDHESGLDYFGARHYASGTGRFTTVDPVLVVGQALVDPQRWNRYAYALNNPLKFTDPDGRNPQLAMLLQRLAQQAAQLASRYGTRRTTGRRASSTHRPGRRPFRRSGSSQQARRPPVWRVPSGSRASKASSRVSLTVDLQMVQTLRPDSLAQATH